MRLRKIDFSIRHHHFTVLKENRVGQTQMLSAADGDEQNTLVRVRMCLDKPASIVHITGRDVDAPTSPGVWRRIGKEINNCWELYPSTLAETIYSAFCDGGSFVEWVDCASQGRKRKRDADEETGRTASTEATHRVDFEIMKELELSTGIGNDISIVPAAISCINYTPTEDPIETGVWWKDDFGKWHCYPQQTVHEIRKAWRKREHYVILEDITTRKYPQGVKYIISLGKMEQTNPISGRTRPILIISNASMPQEAPSPYARKNLTTYSLGSNLLRGGLQKLMSLQFLNSFVARMVRVPHEILTIELNKHLKDDDVGQITYRKFWTACETLIKRVPGCCGQLDRLNTFAPDSHKEEDLLNHAAVLRHVFYLAPTSELHNILKNGLQGNRYIKEDFALTASYYENFLALITSYYENRLKSLESPTHTLLLFLVIMPKRSKGSPTGRDAIPVAGVEHQLPLAVLTLTNPTLLELESGRSGANDLKPLDCAAQNGSCLHVKSSATNRLESEITEYPPVQQVFLPPQGQEKVTLLFKLYCPESEQLRFVGGLVVLVEGRPTEILKWLREIAGLAPAADIRLYKEDSAKSIDQNCTYGENQLEDGSVVAYNRVLTGKERNSHRCPDLPTFWEHTRNRQVLHFRRLSNPTVDEFSLVLSSQDTYTDVVERVAQHLHLEDETRVRLTFNDCTLQQPKPLHLDGGSYSSLLANAYKHTTSILYFEILECHRPELDGSKTLTIAFHDEKDQKFSVHEIALPKRSTVKDAVEKLKEMVKELRHPAEAEMRVFEVHCNRISRIHPANEKIGYLCSTQEWFSKASFKPTLRAVAIPMEDRDLGPQDRLIHVRHFYCRGDTSRKYDFFGEPFLIVVREHETLAHVKERIKSKLQMRDEEILYWKFALLSAGRREYLQGDDLVASRMQHFSLGFYDPVFHCLGLEHVDVSKSLKPLEEIGHATNSSKRLEQVDATHPLKRAEVADGVKSPKGASKPRMMSPKSSNPGKACSLSHDPQTVAAGLDPKTPEKSSDLGGLDPGTLEKSRDPGKDGLLQSQNLFSAQGCQCLKKSETNIKPPKNGKEQMSALDERPVLTVVENSNQGRLDKYVTPTSLPLVICKPSVSFKDTEREVAPEINVPDSEFHSFESTRTEIDVAPGQVWAIYDNHDGMPRFYGLITQLCPSPFKVELSWLEPGKKKRWWVETTGLSVTCGEFEISTGSVIERNIGVFSHLVLEKATPTRGKFEVYPKRGEVWAIFSDWDMLHMLGPKPICTPNGIFTQYYIYDIVQMLDNYSHNNGVPAVRLVKTKGFKTIFHPQEGMYGIKTFQRKDLRKFSHSIPYEKMDKFHSLAIPREAVELDPAALPVEFTNAGTSERGH